MTAVINGSQASVTQVQREPAPFLASTIKRNLKAQALFDAFFISSWGTLNPIYAVVAGAHCITKDLVYVATDYLGWNTYGCLGKVAQFAVAFFAGSVAACFTMEALGLSCASISPLAVAYALWWGGMGGYCVDAMTAQVRNTPE